MKHTFPDYEQDRKRSDLHSIPGWRFAIYCALAYIAACLIASGCGRADWADNYVGWSEANQVAFNQKTNKRIERLEARIDSLQAVK